MRLMMITQDFPPDYGGIQTYMYEYATRISDFCEEFVLVCPEKPNSDEIDKELNFPVYRIKVSNNSTLVFPLFWKLSPIVRNHQIKTTFHAQWQTSWPAIQLMRKGKLDQVFCANHGRELVFNPYKNIPGLESLYTSIKKKCLSAITHHFPVSEYNSEILGQLGIDKSRRTVHINGTNTDLFFPQNAQQLKCKLGLEKRKIVTTISRIVRRKGIDIGIRAIHKLKERIPEIYYLVIGDGPDLNRCKALAEELDLKGYVKFLGKIPDHDLNKYYNLSDVFVMTPRSNDTEFEGFGIVYLEANACQKPVIGSKSGGVPSAVLNGETGLLIKEDSPEELAIALERILTDQEYAEMLGGNGRKRVLQKANWDTLSRELFELLHIQN